MILLFLQEARRILAAEIQHITYNEFLPTLLGQKLMDTFELTLKPNGYHMAYNDELPMTTLNRWVVWVFCPQEGACEIPVPKWRYQGDAML